MVSVYTCQNGVRIVYEHIPYIRSISVGIWVGAGSRFELPEENGITHFIEHMLFKGTSTRTARQIAEEFDRIGGELNAFTTKENTCYYAKVLNHHGILAIDILADMFFHSVFEKNELEKERQVVLEEILMSEDAPDDDIHERLWRVMYPDDALGLPILGTKETLQTFDRNMIQNYMDKHYYPKNVVISLAGNISKELLLHIESLFGHFEPSEKAVPLHLTYPKFHSGHFVKERDVEQSHIAMSYPAISVKDQNYFSFIALNNIIGGNMSSRLFQEVREEKGLAYTIYSYPSCYMDVGAITIYGSTNNQQLSILHETIVKSIEKIKRDGVTEGELENGKEQLKASFLLNMESMTNRMTRNGKNELIFGRHLTIDEIIEKIEAISMDSVTALIQKIFSVEPAVAIIGQDVQNYERKIVNA
ncbi:pitrilysin family protein [Ureibacillus sp. FSL K6-8385]|uniref:M16 family metallopeptidase n=1 Tax=Ureibacillus TaxID=160795 RepID=UPI002E20FB53|nr:pitrilysin family protein [Ureibacillus terrenus]MED3762603.1 pitrilysin family protein [Ureibacillus terrenus]